MGTPALSRLRGGVGGGEAADFKVLRPTLIRPLRGHLLPQAGEGFVPPPAVAARARDHTIGSLSASVLCTTNCVERRGLPGEAKKMLSSRAIGRPPASN